MLVEGATAIWRASGTMAYNSIFEAGRHLDVFQVVADRIGVTAFLGYHWNVEVRGGDFHLFESR